MENVNATLQTDAVQQNARQLVDGNKYEDFVSHELFHQWFGDLVTCESWSNVTMNESFADFSEQLWFEHKWGKDKGDEHAYEGLQKYLRSGEFNKDLVRFYYRDREDVFDNVSYEKGGRILNMLRNYVGDSAFFKALNLYLVTNAFKTGEAQQLRLAFEQVTGQDLNWFWNQWYYGSGHPVLDISYQYNDTAGVATVIINQKQEGSKLFKLPFAIDVYNGADKKRYHVWMNDRTDSFHFRYTNRPDLINVDGDKILLCEKTDHKTYENYIAQLKFAPLYLDRREALEYFAKNHKKELSGGLSDKYSGIRSFTLDKYQEDTSLLNGETLQVIESIAQHDPDKITQSKAIAVLAATGNKSYLPVFLKYTTDSSYSVSGEALQGLYNLDSNRAFLLAKKFSSDAKDRLGEVVNTILQERGTDRDFQLVAERYQSNHSRQKLRKETPQFCEYLARISDQDAIKAGVDLIIQYKNSLPESYKVYAGKIIQKCLEKLAAAKGGEISDYIKSMQP